MKKAEVIYRIVNTDGKDDVDMDRREATRVCLQLRQLLWPPPLRKAGKR